MTPEQKARLGRTGATLLLAMLLAALALQTLLQPELPPPGALAVLLAVKILPLAAFLPFLWMGRMMAALWFSMFLMPYFCWAVLGTFVPGAEGQVALLVAVLIATCFAAALLMIRWQRAADSR